MRQQAAKMVDADQIPIEQTIFDVHDHLYLGTSLNNFENH